MWTYRVNEFISPLTQLLLGIKRGYTDNKENVSQGNSILDSTHCESQAYDYNFTPIQSNTLSKRENEIIISVVIREAN